MDYIGKTHIISLLSHLIEFVPFHQYSEKSNYYQDGTQFSRYCSKSVAYYSGRKLS